MSSTGGAMSSSGGAISSTGGVISSSDVMSSSGVMSSPAAMSSSMTMVMSSSSGSSPQPPQAVITRNVAGKSRAANQEVLAINVDGIESFMAAHRQSQKRIETLLVLSRKTEERLEPRA